MSKPDTDYEKGSSENLPRIDSEMINDFFITNIDFLSAEMKNQKTKRATKECYGDNAIEYVQVKRSGYLCSVKGRITPEHKIHKKSYDVVVEIDEKDEVVMKCACMSCAASCGGCKHGVAFLLWLHRRSEEPSVTEKRCYWKKSSLSRVSAAGEDINSLLKSKLPEFRPRSPTFLKSVISMFPNATGSLFDLYKEPEFADTSIYQIMISFKQNTGESQTADCFLSFARSRMTKSACEDAEKKTKHQSKSSKWFDLRFGRITASNIYEAARCKTFQGALTEQILGASHPLETAAVQRGIDLENSVLKCVAKKKNINIEASGLLLSPEYPIFGASPDGITEHHVIEVKCPFKEKSMERYIVNGTVQPKCYQQIQLQMLFANKQKGYFCVASPHFEQDEEVIITEVNFDEHILEIMEAAEIFWKFAIFPILYK